MDQRLAVLRSLVADPMVDAVLAEAHDPRRADGILLRAVRAFRETGSPPEIISAVAAGDTAPFVAWCQAAGVPVPTFAWLSDGASTGNARLDSLAAWYRGLPRAVAGLPHQREIDPTALRPFLGHLMLLDTIEGGYDFRYRLYGSAIASRAGFDWTGKTVRDLVEHRPQAALAFHAFYRAVLERPQPLFTDHQPHPAVRVGHWQRLILPFSAAPDGSVTRLLVGNFPVDDPSPGASAGARPDA